MQGALKLVKFAEPLAFAFSAIVCKTVLLYASSHMARRLCKNSASLGRLQNLLGYIFSWALCGCCLIVCMTTGVHSLSYCVFDIIADALPLVYHWYKNYTCVLCRDIVGM